MLDSDFLSFAKDGRGGDRDDMEDEHKERELRAKLNAEFQNFVKRVEDIVSPPHIYISFLLFLFIYKNTTTIIGTWIGV